MANVLAPPRPRATATGVLSQHDFSQSSGGTSTAALGGIQIVVEEELKGEDAKEERGGDDDNNNDSTTTTTNNNDNNTQESFTQQLLSMTQNNNELTQLGVDDDMYDDDEDDDDAGGSSQSQDYCHSPIAPIDPLTLPWGRLMPVGIGGGGGGSGHNDDGGIDNNYDNDEADEAPSRPSSSSSQQRGPTEMMPRPPTTWGGGGGYGTGVATRSRSPSLGGMAVESFSSASQHSPAPRIQFLGLKNLIPSDRFNEYVLGRSVKADVTAQKLDASQQFNIIDHHAAAAAAVATAESEEHQKRRNERRDYVHAMVSNRHCRIYCLLGNVETINNNDDNGGNNSPPDMEVFVEDTSGNGTLINGTTLLRKNERRRLHTGDVICLLNPKLLGKKVRSIAEQKTFMSQYSYVFVNLYEQEARHGWGVMGMGGDDGNKSRTRGKKARGANIGSGAGIYSTTSPSVPFATRKTGAAVNVRATKCHSIKNGNSNNNAKGKRSLLPPPSSANATCGGGSGGDWKMTAKLMNSARQSLGQQQQESTSPKNDNAGSTTTSTSLGSFLNNVHQQHHDEPSSSENNSNFKNANNPKDNNQRPRPSSRDRRIEEEYDLRDLLGTGTCGEVRRAIHRRTGEERAVKIISINGGRGRKRPPPAGGGGGNMIMSSENLTAIQAEAEILRSLDHPYVVKLYDTFISPSRGTIYLVMELIRGGDLFDRIVDKRDGRYTEVQARRLFRRILTAVHYLHEERGIVHRDLKPENILVVDRRSDVNIKLTDFGLAKNMTAEGLKTFCGTPQYFAPEVLRRSHTVKGNGRYGKEIDCWSIGVILFILLSGSPPFDVSAGFESVANAEIVFYEDQWDQVSLEARDLVVRLLEIDPRRRMSVTDACEHSWVLMDDGDTHRHPLHDPVVVSAIRTTTAKLATDAIHGNSALDAEIAQNSKKTGSIADDPPPKLPTIRDSVLEVRDSVIDINNSALNPISMRNNDRKNDQGKFRDKIESAPHQSGVEEKERQASIWAKSGNDHDETVTKVIQEACHTSLQPSPNGSPIHKRQLFDNPSSAAPGANDYRICKKKMTMQGVESIKAAGKTLPTPVIDDESRLMKKIAFAPKEKKKKQSTLFDAGGKQQHKNNSKLAASQMPEIDKRGNKRKSSTSTVTPPGGAEQNNSGLVFRLNKKHGGKYISPEGRHNAASANGNTEKAELSEDELRDFSDDDVDDDTTSAAVAGGESFEMKPLEKYLHKKRKTESIESAASIDNLCEQVKSREDVPPQSTSSSTEKQNYKDENLPNAEVSLEANQSTIANIIKKNDRKMVQSFLFSRPPPNNNMSNHEIVEVISLENNDRPTIADVDGPALTKLHAVDGEEELQQSAGESTALKGKQMPITSWFQPR